MFIKRYALALLIGCSMGFACAAEEPFRYFCCTEWPCRCSKQKTLDAALMNALVGGKDLASVEPLVQQGANVDRIIYNKRGKPVSSPLIEAARYHGGHDNGDVVAYVLHQKKDKNHLEDACQWAARVGNVSAVKVLLDAGVRIPWGTINQEQQRCQEWENCADGGGFYGIPDFEKIVQACDDKQKQLNRALKHAITQGDQRRVHALKAQGAFDRNGFLKNILGCFNGVCQNQNEVHDVEPVRTHPVGTKVKDLMKEKHPAPASSVFAAASCVVSLPAVGINHAVQPQATGFFKPLFVRLNTWRTGLLNKFGRK